MIENTVRQGGRVGCSDALGRRRTLEVSLTEEGNVCIHTPPGESAKLDWNEVGELLRRLAELRPHVK
ncbi:hypothetical protein ALI22I_37670 [Saccharothrix sp. ALI-22-I]|uniref:hypothetical protein n=1 Tax=Saccharothrix sp. ALI-22-I TaxID=1933778 RepID=UPI00097CA475|nr:hypothetical protein [Saccharothrix sp. ALI-22-I]ONI81918.1 hypothetical protein ALI22I_37670 [Saccharothrix sp. ALI-22-I]